MYSLYDTWGFPCVFPHSEISGSLAMCAYPKLIAAYHVLHRLLMPRHSPCALCSLTYSVKNFQSFAFNITKNISWLTSQYVWSYILSIYMQFSKNIYFVINVVLLCQLRRSAPHLSNKLWCSLLASAYYSFLTKYLFEKHGFSKLNRNVNINNSYTK